MAVMQSLNFFIGLPLECSFLFFQGRHAMFWVNNTCERRLAPVQRKRSVVKVTKLFQMWTNLSAESILLAAGLRTTRTIEGRHFQAAALIQVRLMHKVRLGKYLCGFGLSAACNQVLLFYTTSWQTTFYRRVIHKTKKVLDHHPRNSTRYENLSKRFSQRQKRMPTQAHCNSGLGLITVL